MKKSFTEKWLGWMILFGTVLLYFIFYVTHIEKILDSDMASELILSELLSKEHRLLSSDWIYSTELRVLNTQIVYSFFFLLFKDYFKVRVASRIVFILLMGGSLWLLCREADIKRWFPFLASVMFLPFSREYGDFVLFGDYYIPHIVISFVSLALIFRLRRESEGRKRRLLFAGIILLSFAAGMGGPRQILVLYLPLFLTACIRLYQSHRLLLRGAYPAFFASAAGYLVNARILSHKYSFSSWEKLNFQRFSMESAGRVLGGILKVLGFCEGEVFSYNLIRNIVCFALLLGIILIGSYIHQNTVKLPETERTLYLYLLVSLAVFTALYVFTDMSYEDRYLLPILLMALPLTGLVFENHKWHPAARFLVPLVFYLMLLASALGVYKDYSSVDKTGELQEITGQLVDNGYTSGYATYWNGNVLRELSDGNLDIYCWKKDMDEIIDVDQLFEWLQEKRHFEQKPAGKVFLLMTTEEAQVCPLLRYQVEDCLAITTEHYRVYGFTDYEQMIYRLSRFTYDLSKTEFLYNGEYRDNAWFLPEGGSTRGPHMTLYAGTYYVTITGENLQNCEMPSTADFGDIPLDVECISKSNETAVYEINVEENRHFAEFVIINNGSGIMKISQVTVERGE